jgi:hypothetical protein
MGPYREPLKSNNNKIFIVFYIYGRKNENYNFTIHLFKTIYVL